MKSLKLYQKISLHFILACSSRSISGLRAILRYGTSSGSFLSRSPKFCQCTSMTCHQIQLQGSKVWAIPALLAHGTCVGTLQPASLAHSSIFPSVDSPPLCSFSTTHKGRRFHSEPKLQAFLRGQPSILQELENSYDDDYDKEDENLELDAQSGDSCDDNYDKEDDDLEDDVNLDVEMEDNEHVDGDARGDVEMEDDAHGDGGGPVKRRKGARLLNKAITARFVRLVTEEGHKVLGREEALKFAMDRDLDLVQVDSTADPPVCKVYDYHKEEYKRKQLTKERKKKQMGQSGLKDIKELRFSSKIESKDLELKCQRARNFLDEGYRVKFVAVCVADGTKQELLDRIMHSLEDVAVIEQGPRLDSRQAWVLLRHVKFGPVKKTPPRPEPEVVADEEEEESENDDEDDYSFGAYQREKEEEFDLIDSSHGTKEKGSSAQTTTVRRTDTSQQQTSPDNSEVPFNKRDSKQKFRQPTEQGQYKRPQPYGDISKIPYNPGTDLHSSSWQVFDGKHQAQIQDPQRDPPQYPREIYPPQGVPGVSPQQAHVGYPQSPEGNKPQNWNSPPYSTTRPLYPNPKQPPTPQSPLGEVPQYPQMKLPLDPHTQPSYPHMHPPHDPPQYLHRNYPPQSVPGVPPQQIQFGYPQSSEGNSRHYPQSPARPPYPPTKQRLSPQSPMGNIPTYPQMKKPVSPHSQPPPYPQMQPPPYPYIQPSPYQYAQSPPQPSVEGSPQGFMGNIPSRGRGRAEGPEGYSSQNLQRYPEGSQGMSPQGPSQSPPNNSYGRGHQLQGPQRHVPPGSPVYPPQGSFGYPPDSSQAQYPQNSQGLDRYPLHGSKNYPPQVLGGNPQQGLPAYPPFATNGHAHQGPLFSPVNHQQKHSPQNSSRIPNGLSPGKLHERYPPQNPNNVTTHLNRLQDENDGSFRIAES